MPAVVLAILKYFFLLLIFLFLARAVRAMYLEVSGPKRQRSPRGGAPARAPTKARSKPPDKLIVTAPDTKPQSYDIDDELILGREAKCNVVLTDAYSSQVHARIFRRNEEVLIEDMGSTNGTYLNRRKVTSATPVNRGDKARIGKTEMEFKR